MMRTELVTTVKFANFSFWIFLAKCNTVVEESRKMISPSSMYGSVDKELLMPEKQRIFPTPENLDKLAGMIEAVGGIEVCYGGIGVHGHVAFNEPGPGVKDTDPCILEINDFTHTVDAVDRVSAGTLSISRGVAITLGMRQCLGARKMLLMTRNEHKGMDWANTVLRVSALGVPGDDYPVTHIRNQKNILGNRNSAKDHYIEVKIMIIVYSRLLEAVATGFLQALFSSIFQRWQQHCGQNTYDGN